MISSEIKFTILRNLSWWFNYGHKFIAISRFFLYKHLQNYISQTHVFNDNWGASILNPFLESLIFISKWKLLRIPFIKILCSHYFPIKYIFNQTFWKYFSLKQESEQTRSKSRLSIRALNQYPKLFLYWSSKLYRCVWRMKENISSVKSQQITWRRMYHIWAKHTVLSSILRNTWALYYCHKTCRIDPERWKPGRFLHRFISEIFRNIHVRYSFPFRRLHLNCNLWFYFLKELHEYFKCNSVYYVIDRALFMLRFSLIIRPCKVYDGGTGLNFFFVFGVINSGIIATVNFQSKCIGFSPSCL